jgi:hypothetical protein
MLGCTILSFTPGTVAVVAEARRHSPSRPAIDGRAAMTTAATLARRPADPASLHRITGSAKISTAHSVSP